MTKPGGLIVYATCSLQPEEGIKQIEYLLDAGAPV
jgi:16S rRNA (cytosine967-C5)-methyltransferase